MNRCPNVHDLSETRVLRCQYERGHSGPCKPRGWEPMTFIEFLRLSRQLRKAE